MTYVPVHCPDCQGVDVVRYGQQRHGPQRYRCNHTDCPRHIFLLESIRKVNLLVTLYQ